MAHVRISRCLVSSFWSDRLTVLFDADGVSTSKHELLTVMAEYDGSGYPLAYLLRKTTKVS